MEHIARSFRVLRMDVEPQIHIIYLKERMVLSKKRYSGWREIQDDYDDYTTSLGPWTAQEVIDFFRDDFPKSPLPFSEARIRAFMDSSDETIST